MRILIAEDDPVSCRLLVTTLRDLQYEVQVAQGGPQAWEILQDEHFPIVVSDWMMPELDGLELCRRIRSAPHVKYTYVILLTARQGRADFLAAMEAGADDFISKPLDREPLHARLRAAERILALREEVKQLAGLLPICSYCRRIRDERDASWSSLEDYLSRHTDATFTHGVCPDCMEAKVKPELDRARR